MVNKIKDRLKQTFWLGKEKVYSFSLMVDILSQSNLGIFEIDGKEKIITKITERQKELLKLFNIEQKVFTNFD